MNLPRTNAGMLLRILLVIVVAAGLGLFGWMRRESGTLDASPDVTAADDQNDNQEVAASADSTEQDSVESLPETFDETIPVYPDAVLQTSLQNAAEGTVVVSWTTTDAFGDVVAYFDANLASAGWETTNRSTEEDFTSLAVRREERSGAVLIASGALTSITVSIDNKPGN